jgi:hypothetical protein
LWGASGYDIEGRTEYQRGVLPHSDETTMKSLENAFRKVQSSIEIGVGYKSH